MFWIKRKANENTPLWKGYASRQQSFNPWFLSLSLSLFRSKIQKRVCELVCSVTETHYWPRNSNKSYHMQAISSLCFRHTRKKPCYRNPISGIGFWFSTDVQTKTLTDDPKKKTWQMKWKKGKLKKLVMFVHIDRWNGLVELWKLVRQCLGSRLHGPLLG